MHLYRWSIELIVLCFYAATLYFAWRVYKRKFEWRYCLRNLMPWMVHVAVFNAAAILRIVLIGASAPVSPWFVWWAAVIRLHGAIALIGVFRHILKNGY